MVGSVPPAGNRTSPRRTEPPLLPSEQAASPQTPRLHSFLTSLSFSASLPAPFDETQRCSLVARPGQEEEISLEYPLDASSGPGWRGMSKWASR